MTTFPDLPDAEKIAAMRARAKTEADQYDQTTVPAMLLQGAAWGEEVVRLRERIAVREAWDKAIREFMRDLVPIAPPLDLSPQVVWSAAEAKLAAMEGPK